MDSDIQNSGLNQGLKQRHMTLISIGGTIGAGLFVGSGVVINSAGPAALLSFLLAGILIMLVMRMLGEMAVARPAVGSFYEYARVGLGEWAGFSIGWLYWYFWVVVVAIETVAGAAVIKLWLPEAPVWLISLVLLGSMTMTNLISVRAFGEFEYWFASIKVIAIVVFIFLGALFVMGLWPDTTASVVNLTSHGGFAPNGWGAVIGMAVPAVAFFVGVELVTVAAAESAEPGRMVARATNSVVVRVLLFYVGSIFLVVTISPWNSQSVLGSPYVAVLERLSIPAAANIMNAVVLVAVLSALNSGLYAASRMLFALTSKGHAPRALVKLSKRGVPIRATLIGCVVAVISIIASYVSPDGVFKFLISSYGAVALFVYLLIAIAQVRLRRRLEREDPDALTFKMWFFPWLSYATIAAMVAVIATMGISKDTRDEFILSATIFATTLLSYAILIAVRKRRGTADVARVEEPTPDAAPVEPMAEAAGHMTLSPITLQRRLVIAYDGSDVGEDALVFGSWLAKATGDTAVVVDIYPQQPGPVPVLPGIDAGWVTEMRTKTDEALDRARKVMDERGVSAEYQAVAASSVARGMDQVATQVRAGMIILGSNHRGVLSRTGVGKTADRLLHGSSVPIVIVPRGARKDLTSAPATIGCAYVPSPDGIHALNVAAELAKRSGAALKIFSVVAHDVEMPEGELDNHPVVQGWAGTNLREAAENAGREVAGIVDCTVELLDGGVVDSLSNLDSTGCQLLVCGSRGYGPAGRVLLGGISGRLVRRARCPVMVVPRASGEQLSSAKSTARSLNGVRS